MLKIILLSTPLMLLIGMLIGIGIAEIEERIKNKNYQPSPSKGGFKSKGKVL